MVGVERGNCLTMGCSGVLQGGCGGVRGGVARGLSSGGNVSMVMAVWCVWSVGGVEGHCAAEGKPPSYSMWLAWISAWDGSGMCGGGGGGVVRVVVLATGRFMPRRPHVEVEGVVAVVAVEVVVDCCCYCCCCCCCCC